MSAHLVRENSNFLKDGFDWSTSLESPSEGDYAEAAHVLTSTHNGAEMGMEHTNVTNLVYTHYT